MLAMPMFQKLAHVGDVGRAEPLYLVQQQTVGKRPSGDRRENVDVCRDEQGSGAPGVRGDVQPGGRSRHCRGVLRSRLHAPRTYERRSTRLVAAREFAATYREAFPDLQTAIEDQEAEGDKGVSRFSGRGTHLGETGEFGAATGNLIEV